MVRQKITETNLEELREWNNAEYMQEGLLLTDHISDAPIPHEPTRLNFILMALCRRGQAQYSIDTHQRLVRPGDLMFVSERHILDSYHASEDFECLCIMLSTQFYHSFVQNVNNVSSLLLFSMKNPVVTLTPKENQVYDRYFYTIREKMADATHHYRTELVKSLLLSMFYDMSNVIWRIEQQEQKAPSRQDALFAGFIRLLGHKIIGRADGAVFQTEGARDFYTGRLHEHSVVIPNAVTLAKSQRTPWSQRKSQIAFVGRFLNQQKRQDLMVEATRIWNGRKAEADPA